MYRRRLPLLLMLLLAMSLFHRCNEDEGLELLSPTADGPRDAPLMKQVQVASDENLSYALEEFFASNPNARQGPVADFDSTHVIMVRDDNHNVIRYSVALENEDNSGIKNLVLTVTPKKEVFAHIFTYVPNNPEQLFLGIEKFTGEMIIADLEGNEMSRSYLIDGQSPEAASAPNGRTTSDCFTTSYYTTVYTPYGSTTSLDYTETWCYSSGSGGGGGGGEGDGGGNGSGGPSLVAVNRALSTIVRASQLPSDPRDGQTTYYRNSDGSVTEVVYNGALKSWLMPEVAVAHYNSAQNVNISTVGEVVTAVPQKGLHQVGTVSSGGVSVPVYTYNFNKSMHARLDCNELKSSHGAPIYDLWELHQANQGLNVDQVISQADRSSGGIGAHSAGGPDLRYVRDPLNPNIIIDMRHMLVMGRHGKLIGESVEVMQGALEDGSAFNA